MSAHNVSADQPRDPALIADYERAQTRLARASDAWLNAVEADYVTEEQWEAITSEYRTAHAAVTDLNDARLFAALERTDG